MAIIQTWQEQIETPRIKYPKLMKGGRVIVLFERERIGTVVATMDTAYKIGYHTNEWEMTYFRDYNEPLTLQNSSE